MSEKIENKDGFKQSVTNLKEFKQDLAGMIKEIAMVKKNMQSQKVPFQVHDVILSKQWNEISGIQSKINYLNNKLNFEREVYENLKQICLSLDLDEENIYILKTGSFQSEDDLIKMERSLNILARFSDKKLNINIVKESKSEISNVINMFLKRFVIFLSKIFIESQSRSELKVHSGFYKTIKKYKFIYQASMNDPEYYSILCKAYLRKSIDLYNKEFHLHLGRLKDLVNSNEVLEAMFEVIIKSYVCLLQAEQNFIDEMGIKIDVAEIFSDVDSLIINFIELFYKHSSYCVLAIISKFINEDNIKELGPLGIELTKKYKVLSDIFIHQHISSNLSFDLIDLINTLKSKNLSDDFYQKLINLAIKKAVDQKLNNSLEKNIGNLQIMLCLKNVEGMPKIISIMKERLSEQIIKTIFNDIEIKSKISNLFGYLTKNKDGISEMKVFIRQVILENCDDSNRKEALQILTKF